MDAIIIRDDSEKIDYRSIDSKIDEREIFIDTPVKTDPTLCSRRREEDPQSPVREEGLRICPVPRKRNSLPEHLKKLKKPSL